MSTQTAQREAVLLDRHPLWLEGLEAVLRKGGVNVVATTTSPMAALALLEEHRPDLFVIGLDMPADEIDGITCLRLARARVPTTKVIALSESEDVRDIEGALSAGAAAYVTKSANAEDLVAAVRQAFSHSLYLARSASMNGDSTGEQEAAAPRLTTRERQILQLVVNGRTNAELAEMLWVTPETIKFHLSNIYRKLGVSNRTEASHWAQIHGVVQPG